jgi:hypothetical protein
MKTFSLLATLLVIFSNATNCASALAQTVEPSVAIRTTARSAALVAFTKNGQQFRDSSSGATINGAAGSLISHADSSYTLHHGTILVKTNDAPLVIATAQAGCRIPKHCTASVAYISRTVYQVEVLKGAESVRVNTKDNGALNVVEHQLLTVKDGTTKVCAAATAEINTNKGFFQRANLPSRLFAQPGTVFTFNKDSGLKVVRGRLLICANGDLSVRAGETAFAAEPGERLAVENFNGRTRVQALDVSDCLSIKTAERLVKLDCGRELFIADGACATADALPYDGIGRRIVAASHTATGGSMVTSEFSMLGMFKNHPAAKALRADHDGESRKILEGLIQTCAAVEYVTSSHGKYIYATTDRTTQISAL